MSTQINVTVGKAGLSDQAKRQTAANRQAKLEADARIKAAAEGQRQRDAARLIRGIDADGKLLFGQLPQRQGRRDKPAAFRSGTGWGMLLVPDADRILPDIFRARVRRSSNANFCERFIYNGAINSPKVKEWVVYPSYPNESVAIPPFDFAAGPSTSNAIKLPADTMPPDKPITNFNFMRSDGEVIHCKSGPSYAIGVRQVSTANGTGSAWQVADENGAITDAVASLTGENVKEVTFEFMFKLGDDPVNGSALNTTLIYAELWFTDQTAALAGTARRYMGLSSEVRWYSYDYDPNVFDPTGYFEYDAAMYFGNGPSNLDQSFSLRNSQEAGYELGTIVPPISMDEWVHVAMVKTASDFKFFVGGVLRGSRQFNSSTLNSTNLQLVTASPFEGAVANAYIYCTTDWLQEEDDPTNENLRPLPIWVHGVRSTGKALYTENFTPPTTITTLA